MSIARDTTAANIRPLKNAVKERFVCGATVAAGELVSLQTDGYVDPSDSTSAADMVTGVALKAGSTGDTIDVVVYGPVQCLTDATIKGTVFNSTTAGEPTQTDSGNVTAAGWAKTATVLFVDPEHLA